MIPHMEQMQNQTGRIPKNIIADVGYGSEENYAYLEEKGINAYVKYNTFDREQKKRRKIPERETYWSSNWDYDEQQDEFICPQVKRLTYQRTMIKHTANGYCSERRIYSCDQCETCPVRTKCTTSAYGRSVMMSLNIRDFRQQARDRLQSSEGKRYRSQRLIEAEAVFGRLKHNWGFRRFLLRGLEKVKTEWGVLCTAHNIAKLAVV